MVIIRYLFVLLVGVLLGAAGMIWLVQSGTGDLVIRRAEVVQDLERRLREMEQQRDALGRQLEDVVARAERMQGAFTDLERRFRDVVEARTAPPRPAEPAPAAPAPTPAPLP